MIVVAGHLCLDVIQDLGAFAMLDPGALVEVNPASFSTGGAVANVGLALARLGCRTTLFGRTGDDVFGGLLRAHLARGMDAADSRDDTVVVPGEATSYTIVLNPRQGDRTFLHHAGCNDAFTASDLQPERWPDARVLHFGYPPLMRGIYGDGGAALAARFAQIRSRGVLVSLDMAMPDAAGPSGRADWRAFLANVLPHVDLFLPSWEETVFMLGEDRTAVKPTTAALADVAARLLEFGPALVGLKLGDHGLYLRTAGAGRTRRAGRDGLPRGWAGREVLSPNFDVVTRGTTGAGDATIAGLLVALEAAEPLEEAATVASAVGACSVEGADAVGGVLPLGEVARRRNGGWRRVPSLVAARDGNAHASGGWRRHEPSGVLLGPEDGGGS